MTDPTTELPAPEAGAPPRPAIEVEPDPADVVAAPSWPGPLVVPALTDVPQDSAVEAVALAEMMRDDLLAYREQIRPILEAEPPARLPDSAFEDVATVRRLVALVADTVSRRRLGGMIAAQHAYRLAERVAGLTILAGQRTAQIRTKHTTKLPVPGPKDILGSAADRARQMALPTDEQFAAAVEMCVDRGSVTYDAMLSALGSDNLTDAQREQRAIMARLAAAGNSSAQIGAALGIAFERAVELARRYGIEVPGDEGTRRTRPLDVNRVVEELIGILDGAASSARMVTEAHLAGVPAEQAVDWSAALWEALVPIVGLRKTIDTRGKAAQ